MLQWRNSKKAHVLLEIMQRYNSKTRKAFEHWRTSKLETASLLFWLPFLGKKGVIEHENVFFLGHALLIKTEDAKIRDSWADS